MPGDQSPGSGALFSPREPLFIYVYTGRPNIALLRVEHHKWLGVRKYVGNHCYVSYFILQWSFFNCIAQKLSNRASNRFSGFKSIAPATEGPFLKVLDFWNAPMA
jgi:hypothetical protein